jgi:hypothetical protein
VVSFTPRPLYLWGTSTWHPLDMRLGGPHSRSVVVVAAAAAIVVLFIVTIRITTLLNYLTVTNE